MVWNGNIAAVPVQTKDAGRRAMQMEGPLNIERDVVKNGVRLDCVFEGYCRPLECGKGAVSSRAKAAERCKAEPAFPQER